MPEEGGRVRLFGAEGKQYVQGLTETGLSRLIFMV